jgi:hypothetical protein
MTFLPWKPNCSAARVSIPLGQDSRSPERALRSTGSRSCISRLYQHLPSEASASLWRVSMIALLAASEAAVLVAAGGRWCCRKCADDARTLRSDTVASPPPRPTGRGHRPGHGRIRRRRDITTDGLGFPHPVPQPRTPAAGTRDRAAKSALSVTGEASASARAESALSGTEKTSTGIKALKLRTFSLNPLSAM